MCSSSDYDDENLRALLGDDDPCFVSRIAISPDTHWHVVTEIIAFVGESDILEMIAESENTDARVLQALSDNPSSHARHYVAANENTTPDTLDLMVADPLPIVRLELCDNPRTSPEALRFLTEDGNAYVALAAKRALEQRASVS